MNSCVRSRILVSLAFAIMFNVSAHAQGNKNQCHQPWSTYNDTYKIGKVRIDAPLGWLFGSVDQKLDDILNDPSMPVRTGLPFNTGNLTQGFQRVTDKFPELTVSKTDRVAVRVSKPSLENCDDAAHTLDVVFHVYTFGFSNYFSRVLETGRKNEVRRSVVETDATEKLANYFPQPLVGFNRTRSAFAGSRLSINQPNGLLKAITLAASGSGNSDEEEIVAVGGRDQDRGLIRHMDYRLGYRHADVPASGIERKEGFGLGQFFAATKPLGTPELVLRFGASIEGGNQQTNTAPIRILPGDVAQSPYGAVKLFAGASMRLGRHAFKASYGVSMGSASTPVELDFVKQVFDTAANLRFMVKNHRPLTLDLQYTAGSIQNRGRLPVAERFFGGNSERNFIASSDWMIRSEPYIRSFPENTFAQSTAIATQGGDRFFSANFTAGYTVWGKPLVPDQVLEDPDFDKLVNFQLGSAENALTTSYLEETQDFRKVAQMVDQLQVSLTKFRDLLNDLSNKHLGDDIDQQIQICATDADGIDDSITQIKKDLIDSAPKAADIRSLVVGFPNKTPPISADVTDFLDDLNDLATMTGIPSPKDITDEIQRMEKARTDMAAAFLKVLDPKQSDAAKKAGDKAVAVMKYPRRVFRELTREANLIAVSPIFIFDAARLRQSPTLEGKVRYAVGGGLKLSIVSLDLTGGYAFNPSRLPWERRGAFVFSMEVSNLFR